jgi:type I restriction enzyme, S subunit
MSDWLEAPLAELADIRVSNVDKKTSLVEKAVKLCNYMDVYSNDYIRADISFMEASATSAEIARFKVDRGDVLITKDSETPDDIGIPSVVIDQIENVICGYHLALIKPKRELVDPVYLSKQLGTDRTARYFSRYAAGSTRYGLSNGAIANTIIPLAPLADQKKIARVLTSIDTAIEKTESLIAKYQKIKAGLMHDLFTRGVTVDGKLRPHREQAPELYHETAVGWFPTEWEPIKLAKYIEFNLYGPRFDAGNYDERGNVKTIRGTDFSKDGEIKYSQAPIARLPIYKINRHILKTGDVVVVTTADCGLTAVFEEQDFCFIPSAYAVKYRFSNSVNPYFIKYFMQTDIAKRQVNKYVRQGTLGNLPGSDLLRFLLSLPKIFEQNIIVQRIETIQKNVGLELQALDKLVQQKTGLMHDLLTGKVPVKSDEQVTEIIGG